MKIVLFSPRGYDNSAGGTRVFSRAATLPPVGLLSVAAVARAAGHDVTVLDGSASPRITNDRWARAIARCEPDMVAFTATTSGFRDGYDVCRRVKELRDSVRTVFGGVHVSWGRERILEQFEAVDCIVAGEGEYALRDIAEGGRLDTIEGVYCRSGASIRSGPPRTTLCRMDDLPFPAYDLLKDFPRRYALPLFNYRRHPGASVVSSRGCVYRCSYCDRSVFAQSFRYNSPEYTFELVKWLATDFGIRHVIFYDDLFTLNRARVARLCSLLRENNLGVRFNCIVRIGHIDRELAAELKSAGCWMVNVGIESGDQELLDIFKDGMKIETMRRDIELLHREGLWVKGLFMMGFPGETETSIRRTIEFACSLPLKDANVTAFTPFPGSPVAQGIHSAGSLDNDWAKMDCTNFVFVPREIQSKQVLQRYQGEFIRRFYHRPFARRAYRTMMLQSPHSYWRLLKGAGTFARYVMELGKIDATTPRYCDSTN